MRQLNLFVGGMSCRLCVREVTARLRDVPGVETVSANLGDCVVRLSGSMKLARRARRVHRHHLPAPTRRHQKRRQR